MENISVDKSDFSQLITAVEFLIEDVEQILDQDEIAEKRMQEIQTGIVKGKNVKDYNEYLRKRGVI